MRTAKHRCLKKANGKTKKNTKGERNKKKGKEYKKHVGGGGEISTILKGNAPPITRIANFNFTQEDAEKYTRHFTNPTDCAFSALQLMGILTSKETEVLRIAMYGTKGLMPVQIELICALKTGFNFEYLNIGDVGTWGNFLKTKLPSGTAIMCGYLGHAFIVFHGPDNKMYLLDPQLPLKIMDNNSHIKACELSDPECFKYLSNMPSPFWVLCNSSAYIDVFQGIELKERVNQLLNPKLTEVDTTVNYNPSQTFVKDVVPFTDEGAGPMEMSNDL